MNAYQHRHGQMETVALGKSISGTILTIILFAFAKATVQDWAAVFTIIAGAVTAGYTLRKWYKEEKLNNAPSFRTRKKLKP